MNFRQVSEINKERALLWHEGGLDEWTIADWSNAMCGEAGETSEALAVAILGLMAAGKSGRIANAVKKYRRLEDGLQQNAGPKTFEEAKEAIAKEIGDTYLYLDLLAQVFGIDIQDAIVSTFNRVSKREGFPQRLPVETDDMVADWGMGEQFDREREVKQ